MDDNQNSENPLVNPQGTPSEAVVPQESQPSSPPEVKPSYQQEVPAAPQSMPPVQSIQAAIHSEGRGGFKIFVTIAIIAIILIYSVVAYLYFTNQSAQKKAAGPSLTNEGAGAEPTPGFSASQIKISNGNVVREIPGGDTSILINKENYSSTGITGFARVVVSPDNSKMCFESWPPAPEPALYFSNIDGSQIIEVTPNRLNCIFSLDSKALIYINSTGQNSPSDIYYYDLEEQIENNLTRGSVPEGAIRKYSIVGLSADGTKIICGYKDVGAEEEESSGECEIDLEGGEVTLL